MVGDVVHVWAVVKFTTVWVLSVALDTVPVHAMVLVDALFDHELTVVPFARVDNMAASLQMSHPGIVRGSNPKYCWVENIVTTAEEFQALWARQPV